jgi:catechol 2,3-dioxygenase-like lactoylglutathione lyase family enzyme
MLIFYALEDRSPLYILAFAGACLLASIYGFAQGAWPFGVVEAILGADRSAAVAETDGALTSRGITMSGVLRSVSTVRVFVDDLERARRFYRDVLELEETVATPGWVMFNIDGKNLILEPVASDDPEHDLVGRLLAVSFDVDDIDAVHQKLMARDVAFEQPPEKQSWGGTLAFLRDPDGNILTLVG